MSAQQLQEAVSRLESVASKLESLAGAGIKPVGGAAPAAAGGSDTVAPFVTVFDGILAGEFARYLDLSSQIGGDVQTQACMVKTAFQALRDFLVTVGKSKKPEQGVFQGLLSPMAQQIQSVTEFREKNRRSEFFNHISGIAESISAIGWVQVEKTPGPFVKDMMDSGIFYTNKVLKDYKEKDQKHVDWTKAWLGTLREMMAYIKEHHTTGCSWNAQGVDASVSAVKAQAPAAGGPPPPPPPGPPPPPPPANISSGGDTAEADRGALFAELNRGGSVTSGLKKVTNDMMTHKNPALKATSKVPGVRTGPAPFKATVTSQPPKVAPKPSAAPAAKPPVLELQEKKWVVEYQVGNKTMMIEDTNPKQTVYMFKCQDSTLQVKGKINSIVIDSCKKVAIAFDAVVSSIEFVNCQSVQAQVMGKCPTVTIDKTDGCQMYLSKESTDAEIITAKSSEMNISVPKDDGDFIECPLPEQFKSKWNGKKFVTVISDV